MDSRLIFYVFSRVQACFITKEVRLLAKNDEFEQYWQLISRILFESLTDFKITSSNVCKMYKYFMQ
jgi:hypothetical protein